MFDEVEFRGRMSSDRERPCGYRQRIVTGTTTDWLKVPVTVLWAKTTSWYDPRGSVPCRKYPDQANREILIEGPDVRAESTMVPTPTKIGGAPLMG